MGSGGVSLQIYRRPSVIWGITLSIRYWRIGRDFSFRIFVSLYVSFYKSKTSSSGSSYSASSPSSSFASFTFSSALSSS